MEEDELEELEEKLKVDYQIGEDIKEKVIVYSTYVIPNSLLTLSHPSSSRMQ